MTLKNSRLESLSRRSFLLAPAMALACGRRRGTAFPGYAFVANAEGRSLAIVDLTTFSVARRIPLDASPTAVIAHPEHAVIYARLPPTARWWKWTAATLAVRRKLRLGASAVGMRLAPDSLSLWVLMGEPRQLVRVPLDRFAAAERIRLPAVPWDFDLGAELAAVSFPGTRRDRRDAAHRPRPGSPDFDRRRPAPGALSLRWPADRRRGPRRTAHHDMRYGGRQSRRAPAAARRAGEFLLQSRWRATVCHGEGNGRRGDRATL